MEQHFRNIVEQASNPICILKGKDLVLEVANAPVFKLWQVGKEVLGKPLLEIMPELKGQQFIRWLLNVYQTGITHNGNEEPRHYIRENGEIETRYFNFIYHPYREKDGTISGVVVSAYDVTEKVNSRKNIEFNEQRYQSLIQSLPLAVYTCDKDGYIQLFNKAATKLWGREPQIGKDKWCGSWKLFNMDGSGIALENCPMAITLKAGNSAKGVEALIERPDGERRTVMTHPQLTFNESGEITGAINTLIDITEQKRIEKELTEAKVFAELATIIAEESKNKAESATNLAKDAVKAKQQFLSNMSHEIRTPMNAIIGFTKVVLKTELTAKQKEYLAAIKTSGDALIVLINDILDLAKVDAGKITFEQTPFKLALSISAMLHLFEIKIHEKNLVLIKEFDAKIPKILLGDSVRLHQIILNLVSNAVKFTTEGSITVGVHLLQEDEEQASIEFSVKDTGIGIAEDKLEDIFENFQQATSSTSRLFGGTGLGLAIAKQLVEQQGGNIQVKSKIGEGSTFSFVLNFQKTTAGAELETALTEFDSEINNIKVLVVEDIPLNQLLMKTVLDDFGFERDIAANGKIAIEKLQSKAYDVILMDLQMPEMNGFEATEYIRNTLHSKIPIIALTADVTTADLERCKEAGMDDYIAKPVDERLLYSKIIGIVMKPVLNTVLQKNGTERAKEMKYTDLDFLIQRTKNNSGLIMEMISAYLQQTPPLISAMKQGLRDQDWDALHAAVHKMIPSFAIMGMSADFENMAKQVLDYARTQQQTEGISELVLQLENVCTQACKELEAEFNKFKNKNS